jgi:hypothetical protein
MTGGTTFQNRVIPQAQRGASGYRASSLGLSVLLLLLLHGGAIAPASGLRGEYLGASGGGAACSEPVTSPTPCTAAKYLAQLPARPPRPTSFVPFRLNPGTGAPGGRRYSSRAFTMTIQ